MHARGSDSTAPGAPPRRAARAPALGRAVAVASVLCACGTTSAAAEPAPAAPTATSTATASLGPSRIVSLAAWGLGSVAEVGFARVGLLAGDSPTLIVYHLGARRPQRGQGPDKSAAPALADGRFVVSDLTGGNENRLGGFFNGFAKAPATARVAIDDADAGRALTFDYERPPGTFAGFWVHLFDSRAADADRVYLDARDIGWLTFEVRGEAGDEPVRVQLADADWEKREDSAPIADVAALVPAGRVTTSWQRAWLDLSKVVAVDRARLASLVFLVDPEGHADRRGRIQVRGLALTREPAMPIATAIPDAPPARATGERKAMWLWETAKLIASPGEVDALVATCRRYGFTDLFVQLPYLEPRVDHHWGERWDEAGMEVLATRLATAGVRVEALDGAPWYARRAWHDRIAMTVAQVGAYNARVPAAARLAGVRFDVEPYLLPEWQGREREVVLADYVAFLDRVGAEARARALAFGVDVPFWLDARDETTGAFTAMVGGRPAIEAIIDRADEVGVMDYRTVAYGADGVIAHGSGELAYASKVGRQIFIGLESVALPDERILTCEPPRNARVGAGNAPGLLVEPAGPGEARLTYVAAEAPRPATAGGARFLVQRDSLLVPADKITFASRGRAALEETMRLSRRELSAEPSFVGFVLHSYESLRPWFPIEETPR